MAGDAAQAVDIVRRFCDEVGFCATVTPTTYVYRNGVESGFVVGNINYPRFPLAPADLELKVETLAELLCSLLGQESYSIEGPETTRWYSHRS